MTAPDELYMALTWLLGCPPDDPAAPATPPTMQPLVEVFCGAATPERCRIGAVYPTPAGLVFHGMQHSRKAVDLNRPAVKMVRRTAQLLTSDSGVPLDIAYLPLLCRHGQPGKLEPDRHIVEICRLARGFTEGGKSTRHAAEYVVTA